MGVPLFPLTPMPDHPPYVLRCEIPASGISRSLAIQVVCEPDEDEPAEASLYKGTEEVVELFEAAVNSQVWHPAASVDAQARLRVAERSWVTAPAGWLFRCEMSHVAPPSFLALLAMFTQTHYSYEPIAEVWISGADTRTVNREQLLMRREELSKMPAGLPFLVSDERWDGAKGLEVAFEFIDSLSQDRFREFNEALGIWDALRLLGGFQLDFSEATELPAPGKTVWMGPHTAEHTVTEFAEDGAAVAALLSLVRWQHIRGMPLRSVTIG